jgi:hemolysin activation/secretion protein
MKGRLFRGVIAVVIASLPALACALDEHFDIARFDISGNTLLPTEAAESSVLPFAGTKRVHADVERAREALELAYRRAGFGTVLVTVPEQEITGGVVRLQVTEASIRLIRPVYKPPEGREFFSPENIRHSLPPLREGMTPNTVAIAEAVQLANENPAKQVEVLIRSTGASAGSLDADITVDATNPKRLFMTLDNSGTDATGQHRLGVGFQHANLFDKDHVATFNYTTSPEKPDQVHLYGLSYRLPLYAVGDSLDMIYAKSDVNAGATATVAGPLQFTGKGDVYGFRYNWLLPRRGEYSQRMIIGLDFRAYDNSCALGGFGPAGCGASAVDVSVRPLSVAYAGQWQRPSQAGDFSFTLVHNVPGADKGRQADFNCSRRPGGVTTECDLDQNENLLDRAAAGSIQGGPPARYSVLRFNGAYIKSLVSDFQVRIAGSAQYSGDALLLVEQFGLAGAAAVRGFAEREASRDKGYVLNLEAYSPNLAPRLGLENISLRGLVFYDQAAGRNNLLSGEVQQNVRLASWGIGARFAMGRTLNIKLDAAQVIDGDVVREKRDTWGHLSLYYAF